MIFARGFGFISVHDDIDNAVVIEVGRNGSSPRAVVERASPCSGHCRPSS